MRTRKMPMNLLNANNPDWQTNVSMKKKKEANESVKGRQQRLANQRQYETENIATNLLNVGERDCKHIKSIAKTFPIV